MMSEEEVGEFYALAKNEYESLSELEKTTIEQSSKLIKSLIVMKTLEKVLGGV